MRLILDIEPADTGSGYRATVRTLLPEYPISWTTVSGYQPGQPFVVSLSLPADVLGLVDAE